MSGTVSDPSLSTYSTAAFTAPEAVDVRFFCGYGPKGNAAVPFNDYLFFTSYGQLEFRIANLAPYEYQNARGMLVQLYSLRTAIYGASSNLDTDRAAVWYHNKDEVRDRMDLFRKVRLMLCDLMQVEPGPALQRGANNIRMVV